MSAANVLGYGSVLLISTELGPADFGAIAALTGLGVVASVPAGTLQVLVAARRSSGSSTQGTFGISLIVGLVMAAALLVVSPVVERSFDLPSVWPVVWLACAVVPTTIGAAQQGHLLGGRQLLGLSTLVVTFGGSRLVASIALALGGAGVSVVMAVWAAASVVTVIIGAALARPAAQPEAIRSATDEQWHWVRSLVRSSIAFGALIVMTNMDVILARHYLDATDSGLYGVASMFARVIFWATQFIAMVVIPRLPSTPGRRIILQAYGAVVVVASPALLVLAVAPGTLLTLLGLDAYRSVADQMIGFGLLGVLWACIQVSAFVGISRERSSTTAALWLGVVAQLALTVLWLHDSTGQVLAAAAVGALVSLGAAWAPSISRLTVTASESAS